MDNNVDNNVDKLDNIKNLMYEAEGLLELAQLRPEKLQELLPLVEERVKSIGRSLREMRGATIQNDNACDKEESEVYSEILPEVPTDDSTEVVPEVSSDVSARAKPLFCLNDRFKFRRMIFGGSDADFNSAMDYLATLDSYEEAEEYFYNELGLDPGREEVEDFMNVIKTYYGL